MYYVMPVEVSPEDRVGIFPHYEDCRCMFDQYGECASCIYKQFETFEQAVHHMNRFGYRNNETLVHVGSDTYTLEEYCGIAHLEVPAPSHLQPHGLTCELDHALSADIRLRKGDIHLNIYGTTPQSASQSIMITYDQWLRLKEEAVVLHLALCCAYSGEIVEPVIVHAGSGTFALVLAHDPTVHVRQWTDDDGIQTLEKRYAGLSIGAWHSLMTLDFSTPTAVPAVPSDYD